MKQRLARGADFNDALAAVKLGASITRAGWADHGLEVRVQYPSAEYGSMGAFLYRESPVDCLVKPCHRTPWLPDHDDLFALDWIILGKELNIGV